MKYISSIFCKRQMVKVIKFHTFQNEINSFIKNELTKFVFGKGDYVRLVFSNFIKFMKDNNFDTNKIDIQEGYYWFDRQIIKCYDTDGNIYKIARMYIDDNLKITWKYYKNKPFDIASWDCTLTQNKSRLINLEHQSLLVIKQAISLYNDYEPIILTSGGKDSSVVMYLVRQLNCDTKAFFNNTTLDCADTYLHIKDINNIQTITPKEGFYQWRNRNNFIPTRFSRACCSIFKEQALIDQLDKNKRMLFFMGMRNEESSTRANYQYQWRNNKWGNREWQGILPIRKWTETDIWLYILWKNIKVNDKYTKGYGRVGCAIACPFYSKSTWVLDKYWYPYMYNRWKDIIKQDFIQNNKWIIMNCTLEEYYTNWNGGVVREEPTKEVVEEFAIYNNLSIETATKYFNHRCTICDKKIKDKQALSMNLKYLGRNTNKYYCKNHLMQFLSEYYNKPFDKNRWNDDVKRFQEQGCTLF